MLKVYNNWENYEYYDHDIYGGRRIYDFSKVKVDGRIYHVHKDVERNMVYDHGHKYDVESIAFYIDVFVSDSTFIEVNLREVIEAGAVVKILGDVEFYD